MIDGYGNGYGDGNGNGYGDGSGDGYGYGYGDGDGDGYSDGNGNGYGYGDNNGSYFDESTKEIDMSIGNAMVGKFCIVRCYSAGVHAGTVAAVDGDKVILYNSRRLWYWQAKAGVALSGVAQNGITDASKIDTVNPEIYLTGVIELIPCTDAAKVSIENAK